MMTKVLQHCGIVVCIVIITIIATGNVGHVRSYLHLLVNSNGGTNHTLLVFDREGNLRSPTIFEECVGNNCGSAAPEIVASTPQVEVLDVLSDAITREDRRRLVAKITAECIGLGCSGVVPESMPNPHRTRAPVPPKAPRPTPNHNTPKTHIPNTSLNNNEDSYYWYTWEENDKVNDDSTPESAGFGCGGSTSDNLPEKGRSLLNWFITNPQSSVLGGRKCMTLDIKECNLEVGCRWYKARGERYGICEYWLCRLHNTKATCLNDDQCRW